MNDDHALGIVVTALVLGTGITFAVFGFLRRKMAHDERMRQLDCGRIPDPVPDRNQVWAGASVVIAVPTVAVVGMTLLMLNNVHELTDSPVGFMVAIAAMVISICGINAGLKIAGASPPEFSAAKPPRDPLA